MGRPLVSVTCFETKFMKTTFCWVFFFFKHTVTASDEKKKKEKKPTWARRRHEPSFQLRGSYSWSPPSSQQERHLWNKHVVVEKDRNQQILFNFFLPIFQLLLFLLFLVSSVLYLYSLTDVQQWPTDLLNIRHRLTSSHLHRCRLLLTSARRQSRCSTRSPTSQSLREKKNKKNQQLSSDKYPTNKQVRNSEGLVSFQFSVFLDEAVLECCSIYTVQE